MINFEQFKQMTSAWFYPEGNFKEIEFQWTDEDYGERFFAIHLSGVAIEYDCLEGWMIHSNLNAPSAPEWSLLDDKDMPTEVWQALHQYGHENGQKMVLARTSPLSDEEVRAIAQANKGIVEVPIKVSVNKIIDLVPIEVWNDFIETMLNPGFVWGGNTGINWEVVPESEDVVIDVTSEPELDI